MHFCVGECTCKYNSLWKPEAGVGSPGAGVNLYMASKLRIIFVDCFFSSPPSIVYQYVWTIYRDTNPQTYTNTGTHIDDFPALILRVLRSPQLKRGISRGSVLHRSHSPNSINR